jgi:hypothetical protein
MILDCSALGLGLGKYFAACFSRQEPAGRNLTYYIECIAQPVEREIDNLQVNGSNPLTFKCGKKEIYN